MQKRRRCLSCHMSSRFLHLPAQKPSRAGLDFHAGRLNPAGGKRGKEKRRKRKISERKLFFNLKYSNLYFLSYRNELYVPISEPICQSIRLPARTRRISAISASAKTKVQASLDFLRSPTYNSGYPDKVRISGLLSGFFFRTFL